jgi:branched-chain amino acid transport system permease protein
MLSPLRAASPQREALVMAAAAAILVALPWIVTAIGGYRELATRILIWGIFALGFDILVGFTGFLSFGHAAFWGVSAYATGLVLLRLTSSLLLAMAAGIGLSFVLSFVLGYLTLRRHGIYFAILTLAFAEMLYYAALAPLEQITGGENGLTALPKPMLFGMRMEPEPMYWFIAAVTLIAIYFARRIARSPYGLILRALKSNEMRLRFTGIDVRRYEMVAFVTSGIYAGIGGSLYAAYESYVPTQSLHWTTSGTVVMMSVIGGLGTLFGPMLGAGIVLYLENVLSAATGEWQLILGAIFMAFVIFLPGGVVEAIDRLYRAVAHRGRAGGGPPAALGPAP